MPSTMPVYQAEAEAGLTDIIQSDENRTIACVRPLLINEEVTANAQEHLRSKASSFAKVQQALATNKGQFDLHYLYTILASTGWNKNDDVFDRYETWGARHTSEDKPFNLQHEPSKIIGHITGCCVVNKDYELVSDNLTVEKLPDKFHILTSAVIYKHISGRDKELTEATQEMLEEIARGEWYVSMEALFSNFDYAFITPEQKHVVIPRDEATAYLSKHLRVYGGSGEYNGNQVGRMLRNITFSGKGLVKKPGNPESIIFDDEETRKFQGVLASVDSLNKNPNILLTSNSNEGDDSMSENVEQVRSLQAALDKANTAIASFEQRLKEMDEAQILAKFEALEAKITERDGTIASVKAELDTVKTALTEAEKSRKEVEDAKAELENQVIESKTKLDEIEAARTRTDRISALVDKGVDKADAETIVDKFTSLDEEQFGEIVEAKAEVIEAKKAAAAAAVGGNTNAGDGDGDDDGNGGDAEHNADAGVLDGAGDGDGDGNANLGVGDGEGEGEALSSELTSWFSRQLSPSQNR